MSMHINAYILSGHFLLNAVHVELVYRARRYTYSCIFGACTLQGMRTISHDGQILTNSHHQGTIILSGQIRIR